MRYDIGDVIEFTGSGIPNENITIILEDPLDVEVFSKTFNVNDSGNFNFSVAFNSLYHLRFFWEIYW